MQQQWTEAQLRGITTTGRSLLVSAAAGSGKTAMLAARCAYLVCDAPDRCDVDQLLVVTFTEAAAAQMKERIHTALRERADASGSERLGRQVALTDQAHVSTLHSFCARLLREHFHAVGLDPAFGVLDGDEAWLLRREVARQLFDDRYELDDSGDFHRFVDAYGESDDAPLIRRVIHTHAMLESLVEPSAWLTRCRDRIIEATAGRLEDAELGQELTGMLAGGIRDLRRSCARAVQVIEELGAFPQYATALAEWEQIISFWDRTLAGDGIDALAEQVGTLELPRLPSVSNSVPGKEQAKAAVDSVRHAMTKGAWRDLLRFTTAEWQDGLRAIRPHADVFLGLVDDFGRRYRMAKDASRVVDFSDLEHFALQVLREGGGSALVPSPAARAYHRRFRHVLVDEYQDINEVQDAILTLLSRECLCGDPTEQMNLFCVGDVKQSIYRFRLAEAARFLERQRIFRADAAHRRGEVIDLQSNFRSRGPLLDAINGIFERLMTSEAADIQYDLSHRLHAGLKYPDGNGATCFTGSPLEMHLVPDDRAPDEKEAAADSDEQPELDRAECEAALVAQRIRQMTGLDGSAPTCVMENHAAGGMSPRPVRFGDIVILLRSMRVKAGQYADVLRRAGIPVHAETGAGYFEAMEIRDMLALLAVLENQRQDIPLAAVLRSPIAQLAEPENLLARIRIAFAATGDRAVPFHDAVVRYAAENGDAAALRLRGFLAQLDEWRQLSNSRPLAELLWTIYQQSGYLAFCSGLHDGQQRVANLMDLHARSRQFGTFQRQGLSRFLQFLHGLREEADLGQAAVATEADDAVRIMSIHRSKGLEFPVVVLPDLAKRINLSDCQGSILADRKAGLGLAVVDDERMIRYPSLASVLVQCRLRQQALAEELRVLYVAMTRAREHLILVGTCDAGEPQRWETAWSKHEGPLPSDAILGARCMLDWLGPAAAAAAGAGQPIIHITSHTADEIAAWEVAHSKRPILSEAQGRLAALAPLSPPPPIDATAQTVIDSIEFRYRFDAFARLPAAQAVTGRNAPFPPLECRNDTAGELAVPRFLSTSLMSAADVGIATHLVLGHLDFGRRCDAPDLDRQIAELVTRRLLTSDQARAVDRAAIAWLMGAPPGILLRQHATMLRRELPIHFAAAADGMPQSPDPLDRVMVRGRIDVLIPLPTGGIIIDYKTDRIRADQVRHRADDYAPQLRQYCRAVQRITGKAVAQAWLIFLSPRVSQLL